MIINASNKEKIMGWFSQHGLDALDVEERFNTHGLLAIQGPHAKAVLLDELPIDWDRLGRFQSQVIDLFGTSALVMRTGYTGEDGIEISICNDQLPQLWEQLVAKGIAPCGLAARDSLRIESGLPLYGHELNETLTPLQTRYQWVLKWQTGFIGETALQAKKDKTNTKTVGLRFFERCLARQGNEIKEGGSVTSGTFSPVLNAPIAMAMVPNTIHVGQTVTVAIRSREFQATVVELPFI
jgi:aminomethyltransferase